MCTRSGSTNICEVFRFLAGSTPRGHTVQKSKLDTKSNVSSRGDASMPDIPQDWGVAVEMRRVEARPRRVFFLQLAHCGRCDSFLFAALNFS